MNHKVLFWTGIIAIVCLIFYYQWKLQLIYNSNGVSLYTPESMKSNDSDVERKLTDKFVKGKSIAKTKKVIITGLLRDVEKSIPFIVKKVEAVGNLFLDYAVLIVENNSKDFTRTKLLEWAKRNPRVTILGCGVNYDPPVRLNEPKVCHINFASAKTEGHGVTYQRIDKMVKLRNISLDYIKSNHRLRTFDYTIMWDLDIIGTTYLDGILISIADFNEPQNSDISGICANGIRRYAGGLFSVYYDTYAHQDYNDNFHINKKMYHDIEKGLKHAQHPRGSDLLRVESCFSGFTIYRTKDLLPNNVRYTMTPYNESGNIECEHVRLAKTLNGSMAMSPTMSNLVLLNT